MRSVIFGADNNFPSASVAQYNFAVGSLSSTWNSTEALRAVPMPTAGTLSKLYVELDTAPGVGKSYQFDVMKNGSSTGVTVTISDAATTATDSTNSIAFAANDTISLRATPAGTPTLGTNVFWTMEYDSAGGAYAPLLMGAATAASTTVTNYGPLTGGTNSSSAWNATEANESIPAAAAGTISNLSIKLSSAPAAGKSLAFTLMKNGVATSLTATVSDAATTGTDSSHVVTVALGDTLSWQVVPSGTPTIATIGVGAQFNPSTVGETFFGMGGVAAPSTSATNYEQGLGIGNNGWNSTETLRQMEVGAQTLRRIYAVLVTAPAAGKSRTATVRQNAGATSITATISDAATTGNGSTDTTFAQGDKFAIQTTPSGTPTATAGFHTAVAGFLDPALPALVQSLAAATTSNLATSVAAALPLSVTTGNLIVVVVAGGTQGITSVTDSQSNTYTSAVSDATYSNIAIYYAKNVTGGTVTVTANMGGAGPAVIEVYEIYGADTSAPLDKTQSGHGNGSVASLPTMTTAATTVANEIVIGAAAFFAGSGASTWTAGSGYGNLVNNNSTPTGGQTVSLATETKNISATGAQTVDFGTSSFSTWEGVTATFKVSGGAATQTLVLPTISSGAVLYAMTLTPGAVSLTMPTIGSGSTVYAPTLTQTAAASAGKPATAYSRITKPLTGYTRETKATVPYSRITKPDTAYSRNTAYVEGVHLDSSTVTLGSLTILLTGYTTYPSPSLIDRPETAYTGESKPLTGYS
jgi:hypothetical protein